MRFTVWIPRTLIGVVSSIIAGMALGLLVFWVVSGGEGEEGRLYPALALGLIAALSGGTWVGTKIEQWRARTEIEEERRARAVMSYWLEAMSPAPPAPKGTVSDLDIAVDHPADAFLRRFSDFTRTIRTPN